MYLGRGPAVHTDQDLLRKKPAGEVTAGKLATLVGVEDAGRSIFQCDHQDVQAKYRVN